MNYNVLTIPPFDKQLKRLVKKYPSLKIEFADLIESLEQKPEQGSPLGNNCFKIRLAIAAKGKGKSGGARIITNVLMQKLWYIYSIFMTNQKKKTLPIKN